MDRSISVKKVIIIFIINFYLQFFITHQAWAITQISDLQPFTLSNGLQIVVLEDHSIPNANMYLFWKVGSRNEYPGITGLSHFFEHMMFNGSKKFGPKQFDRIMESKGGANNAYTTEDDTVYTNWFPSSSLETIFQLEADRIQYLSIDKNMVESERGVVTSERTTGLENSNYDKLEEEVKSAAFRAHPYSWSVIGHQSDIDHWTMQDLVNYHKTYYAPNNAFVVIVGDVNFEHVKKLAQKYFEPIPAQQKPREIHTVEPKQIGERRVYVHKPSASSVNILMAYHVPNTRHPDHYPLTLLKSILGDGTSSRLYRSLVDDKQLATQVYVSLPDSIDPYLFSLYVVAENKVTEKQLESAIIDEINKILDHGVTQKELDKVKNSATVNFYRNLSTINGKANSLGNYQLFYGGYKKMFTAPNEINAVTLRDIKRVANKYLVRENRTIGILNSQKDSKPGDK